ncbi:purine permease 3-like isoform X2 [Wolffia australiana]
MEVESRSFASKHEERVTKGRKTFGSWRLLISIIGLVVGSIGGPLLTRVYFVHGGSRIWLTTLLQFVAFPLCLPFMYFAYLHRKRRGENSLVVLSPKARVAGLGLGILNTVICYIYGYGSLSLPLSISTIILYAQVVFNALFAFLLVKHKFTVFSVNALVVLVSGVVLLGVQSSSERSPGEDNTRYYKGFVAMIGTSVLNGLLFPLIEWTFLKFKQKLSVTAVVELQIIFSISGGVFTVVGMLINHDFLAI